MERVEPSKVWFKQDRLHDLQLLAGNFNPSKVWFKLVSTFEPSDSFPIFQSLKGLIQTSRIRGKSILTLLFQSLKGLIQTICETWDDESAVFSISIPQRSDSNYWREIRCGTWESDFNPSKVWFKLSWASLPPDKESEISIPQRSDSNDDNGLLFTDSESDFNPSKVWFKPDGDGELTIEWDDWYFNPSKVWFKHGRRTAVRGH